MDIPTCCQPPNFATFLEEKFCQNSQKTVLNPYGIYCRQPSREFARLAVDCKPFLKKAKTEINLTDGIRIEYNIYIGFREAFNRTNLEWKLLNPSFINIVGVTFNRTNLEWKP